MFERRTSCYSRTRTLGVHLANATPSRAPDARLFELCLMRAIVIVLCAATAYLYLK